MKVSYPLSLKISLWLLLNLLLLAAGLVLFLGAQSGVGWDALVRGPAGNRAQELGRTVAMEFSAETEAAGARGVLQRYGRTYGAGFFAVHPNLPGATSPREELPDRVGLKIDEGRNGPGGARGGPGRRSPPEAGAPPPASAGKGDNVTPRAEDEIRGRFLMRTGEPAAFWLGVRVPTGRPIPVTVVIRTESWWVLMGLLDLQPWLLAGGGAVIFSILFWLPLVSGMTRALRQLTAATEKIADGKFDTRVPARRRDEIGALGGSVNRMAARLDTLVHGQKRFLGDVAHELGSPLGRLQVATEILETRAEPALREHVADVREEVQHMAALVNELLAFTKAGLRPRDAALSAVALAPLVQRVLTREDPAHRVKVDLSEPDLSAHADADLLERALGNLVRNALRYAPDGAITLTVRRSGRQVFLNIADEGPGVSAESLARLGEPFYRPDAARTSEAGGTGLGLAIVRSGIVACGGTVNFRNRTPRGFEAEVTLAAA